MRIAVRQLSGLDPARLSEPGSVLVARQIFEPLVSFDPKTLKLAGAGASEFTMEEAGARWVFRLRPGSVFHNGKAVTAPDVTFSLNRLASKATGAEHAYLLDQVIGFEAVNGTGAVAELEGLRALDESTLEFRLKSPWVEFPYVLTHPATAPIPRAAFEADPAAFASFPIGSGPYRISGKLRPGQDVVITSFGRHHTDPRSIRRAEFFAYDRSAAAWTDFEEGSLDITEAPAARSSFARARYGDSGFSLLSAQVFLGFNAKTVTEPRMRKAIGLAIDRRAIAESVYEGLMVPPTGIVPKGLISKRVCGDGCRTDVESARALIKEAYPEGVPALPFEYQSGVTGERLATAIEASLEVIGVDIVKKPLDVGNFVDALSRDPSGMFRLGWVAEFPLADWFVTPLFRSGSPDNRSGFSSPEVDDLLIRARAEPNPEKRADLYAEAQDKVAAQSVVIPIGQFRNHFVARERVGKFYADVLGGFDLARLEIRGED